MANNRASGKVAGTARCGNAVHNSAGTEAVMKTSKQEKAEGIFFKTFFVPSGQQFISKGETT